MDVFYYWKDYEDDVKKGAVGRFVSRKNKLEELNQRSRDYVWAFKTPKGCKGRIQLIAKLWWSDQKP